MNIVNYPLSGLEMRDLNMDANLIKYTDLYKYTDINDLFKDKDKLIILYLVTSESSGHWICLFKNKDGFNFFDSYGLDIDDEQNFITHSKLIELNEQFKYLTKMLKDYKVVYNNVIFQNHKTETCGCHVTFRLNNSHLNLIEYTDIFLKNNIKDPDYYVANYCFKKLKYI